MLRLIGMRLLLMIPTLFAISVLSFTIIQLPPGDFAESMVANLQSMGDLVDESQIEELRQRYGLDLPMHERYIKWMGGVLRGDLGQSLEWGRSVSSLVMERLPATLFVTIAGLIFVWAIGIPIGVYSATHKNSLGDYFFTILGYIGISVPGFLLAIIIMYVFFLQTGETRYGLFSEEYALVPWSITDPTATLPEDATWLDRLEFAVDAIDLGAIKRSGAKALDLLKHLWIPGLLAGLAGTAGIIRTMRANLLDELGKPYVTVARAKGLGETRLLYKYPFRIACNPVVSTIGWILPRLIGGQLLVSIVLGIPTLAPIMLSALLNQDMYLGASIIMIQSCLAVIGTLISDLLLVWVDPRIREAL